MNLQQGNETTEVSAAAQNTFSATHLRKRTGLRTTANFDPVVVFGHGGVTWMCTGYLLPEMLVGEPAEVGLAIFRDNKRFDTGKLLADPVRKTITPVGFQHCLGSIRGKSVRRLSMGLLEDNDAIHLSGIHNGFFGRSRALAADRLAGIKSILSLEAMQDAKQRFKPALVN